jgi:hypothetical protein
MFQGLPSALMAVAAALLAGSLHAQQAQPVAAPARPDPLNAKAVVPPAVHVSPLRAYRPAGDTTVGSWKDANDTVTRIGGWRTYLREATRPEPAPAASPASAPASAPAGRARDAHGHHGPR